MDTKINVAENAETAPLRRRLLHNLWIPSPIPVEFPIWLHNFPDFWSFRRMIYWADHPLGDIGVSFVDSLVGCGDWGVGRGFTGFMSRDGKIVDNSDDRCDFLRNLFDNGKVLNVSSNSEDELGRLLATDNVNPFDGRKEQWMYAYDKDGNRIDDVMLYWGNPISRKAQEYCDLFGIDHDYDTITNTFTNSAFNYLYIKRVLSDKNLVERLKLYDFFTDGEIVDTRFGYYSPAYALALLKSLQKHALLSIVRDFNTFRRYEPIDPITTLCKRIALAKFKGVSFGDEVCRARNAKHNYSMLDKMIADEHELEMDARYEREMEREYWDGLDDQDAFYVDGVPVYGADDQEDAEIQYWNTH